MELIPLNRICLPRGECKLIVKMKEFILIWYNDYIIGTYLIFMQAIVKVIIGPAP